MGKPKKERTSLARKEEGKGGGGDADELDAWMKSRQLLKPEDQLELTEAELNEEVTKVLTSNNTNVLLNLVVYSFKHGEFIPIPPEDDTVQLFSLPTNSLLVDSEEAKKMLEESGDTPIFLPAPKIAVGPVKEVTKLGSSEEEIGEEGEDMGEPRSHSDALEAEIELDEEEEGEEEEEPQRPGEAEDGETQAEEAGDADRPAGAAPPTSGGRKRKLVNQFNFCERGALTYTNPMRNVDTQTIPPPRSTYSANVMQWNIYDSYAADQEAQRKEKEKKDEKKAAASVKHKPKKSNEKKMEAEELNRKYLKCWQILERMINQNIYDDIANDYRYFEDPADEYREGEGVLLPLWKFTYEKTKRMTVTDLMFNPAHFDLFAVCYGSYDFLKQPNEGVICLFTVKNPAFPDYIITTASGVMCCDIHTKYPFLLAVGMYDGTVAVYNLRENYTTPLYISVGVNGKHAECVTEIKWGPDMSDGEVNFFSISADGHVFNWILMPHDLSYIIMTRLIIEDGIVEGPDGTQVQLKGCGSCMKFHPQDPSIYLVGTEEGDIFKCSTAFSSKTLMNYAAHNVAVYAIDFNRYNSNIFLSCSGDWRIKVWEDMRADPLFIFDLGSAVFDAKWAPYSSTVFAGVTSEGKVFVFDINVNKYKPICIQAVVPKRKSKLTRIAFNEKLPFIIVGDDKGGTTALKLSPNLRVMVKPPKKQQYLDQRTLQITKLDRILSLVRELPEGYVPKEAATTVAS